MRSESLPNPRLSRMVIGADSREAIRRRAEEIYLQGGRIPGHDLDNCAQAEAEILAIGAPLSRREDVREASRRQGIGNHDCSQDGHE